MQSFKKYLVVAAILTIALCVFSLRYIRPKTVKHVQPKLTFKPFKNPYKELVANYVKEMRTVFDSTNTVGCAFTIVYNSRVLHTQTFGVKQVGSNDSIDIHTSFRLASVSKGFAGVLACILEEERLLSLDDRVKDYLPDFRLRQCENSDSLTIRQTLSHTSGLVPHAFDNLAEDGMPYSQILTELCNVEITDKPGKVYGYQNIVYSLLDTILYVKTGKPYSELLREYIFRPLRMRDASTGTDIYTHKRNVALPHKPHGKGFMLELPNLGYYNMLPAAGVNASITDMGKWLLALLGDKPHTMDRYVLDKIETPVIETPLQRHYTRAWGHVDKKYYSLGWRIFVYKGKKIIYHGGYVSGYRAEIAFCPEDNIGIAFLENSPNALAAKSVPLFFNLLIENQNAKKLADSLKVKQ